MLVNHRHTLYHTILSPSVMDFKHLLRQKVFKYYDCFQPGADGKGGTVADGRGGTGADGRGRIGADRRRGTEADGRLEQMGGEGQEQMEGEAQRQMGGEGQEQTGGERKAMKRQEYPFEIVTCQ